jgi:chitinase
MMNKARSLVLVAVLGAFGANAWAKADDKVFVGYLYGPARALNYRLYTHLCHAFVVADEEGKIRPSQNVPSKELTAAAHEAGVKVLISLGGWGWDKQFAALTSKPESEDRYVTAVLKMVDDYDYDGIDLDWEYPDTKDEVANFERLTRRIRKGLDEIGEKKGRRHLVTMAAAANPGTLRWLETAFLVETMDWINLMTYDMAGDWTPYAGHHAPLHASSKVPGGNAPSLERSVNYLLQERKLPANRIALGIPLYGKSFPVGEPYAATKGVPKGRLPRGDYANLKRLRDEEGWTLTHDEETKAPWLTAPDKSAIVGLDDVESVALKTKWAMEKGLRGVFFWQVNGDRLPDGTNPLQDASRKALDQAKDR